MSAPRAGSRFYQTARQSYRTSTFRQIFRRHQSATASPAAEAVKQSIFQRLWTSEVGVKTVHFWAPIMKWGVVLAGVGDFFRPAEKLSLTQNLALMATGSIWTRWCFVIKPQNMFLAAVNFCLFIVGTVQVSRILTYRASAEGSAAEAAKSLAEDVKGSAESLGKEAKKELA